jgi:hypothetical protein
MNEKLTSSLIALLLMVNIFFEMSMSHHSKLSHQVVSISQTTIQANSVTNKLESIQDFDACVSGTCHSGYCKLLVLNVFNYSHYVLNQNNYILSLLNMPDSPYLKGNRRPPKYV